jgi:RHS repeat-associated protein
VKWPYLVRYSLLSLSFILSSNSFAANCWLPDGVLAQAIDDCYRGAYGGIFGHYGGGPFACNSDPNQFCINCLILPNPTNVYDQFQVGPKICLHEGTPPNPPSEPPPNCPVTASGSIIQIENQTVGESIPLTGVPFALNYSSGRVPNRTSEQSLRIQLVPSSPSYVSTVLSVDVTVIVAGRTLNYTFPTPISGQTFDFAWDGLDSSSNPVFGTVVAQVTVAKTLNPGLTPESPTISNVKLSRYDVKKYGLGGWTFEIHHFYDPATKTMFLGNGTSYKAPSMPDGSGGLITAARDGSEIYIFDSTGKHLSTRTPLKAVAKYTFSYSGDILTSITDRYGNVTTVNHTSGNPTSITAPHGQVSAITVDGNGYLKDLTNPSSEKTEMTYYSGGLLHTFKNPKGAVATMTYDGAGRLLSDVNSAGNSLSLSATYTDSADWKNHKTISTTTAEGINADYQITDSIGGYVRNEIKAGFSTRNTAIDKFPSGQLTQVVETGPTGVQISQEFQDDPQFMGLVQYAKTTWTSGPSAIISKETFSKNVSFTNPADIFSVHDMTINYALNYKYWQTVYYAVDSKYVTQSPVGRIQETVTNSNEDVSSLKRGTLIPLTFTYNTDGTISEMAQGSSRAWNFTYDSNGNMSSVQNPLSQTTSYTYDSAGRVVTQTYPDSRVAAFGYDANGNLASVTPPSKPTQDMSYNNFDLISSYLSATPTTYAYNNDKKITQITKVNGDTIDYNYNSTTGRLTSIDIPTGTFTFTPNSSYDQNDQVQSPDGVIQAFTYNGDVVTSMVTTGPTVGTLHLGYSGNFRLNSVQVDSQTARSINYDDDGIINGTGAETMTLSSSTGAVTGASLDSITETYTYDSSYGELASFAASYLTNNIYSTTFTRDSVGRISTNVETIGSGSSNTRAYTYDSSGRLTSVTLNGSPLSSYVYDSNGNKTQVTYSGVTVNATYNTADQLATFGTKTYTYNVNGELSDITDSSSTPAGSTALSYDAFANLKSVTLNSTTVYSYLYDGYNRRVGKKVGSTLTQQFMWMDNLRIAAEYDGTGTLVSEFIYGSKVNVPDYIIKGSDRFKVITNHLGSVVAVVNSSTGTVAQQISYDDFGQVLSDSNPGFQPFGFAGGLYDPDTKLVRFGARDYDGETGRWLSKDPILFKGGDTNLYGYVLNDPINLVDPKGTTPGICIPIYTSGIWYCLPFTEPPQPPEPPFFRDDPPNKNCIFLCPQDDVYEDPPWNPKPDPNQCT